MGVVQHDGIKIIQISRIFFLEDFLCFLINLTSQVLQVVGVRGEYIKAGQDPLGIVGGDHLQVVKLLRGFRHVVQYVGHCDQEFSYCSIELDRGLTQCDRLLAVSLAPGSLAVQAPELLEVLLSLPADQDLPGQLGETQPERILAGSVEILFKLLQCQLHLRPVGGTELPEKSPDQNLPRVILQEVDIFRQQVLEGHTTDSQLVSSPVCSEELPLVFGESHVQEPGPGPQLVPHTQTLTDRPVQDLAARQHSHVAGETL